jgi:hypothetical protein
MNAKTEQMLAAEASHGSRHTLVSSARFAVRNFSVLAYANGFTLWHYKAGKAQISDVMRAGFFKDAADMLSVGDLIMVSAIDGAQIVCTATAELDDVVVAVLA